MDEAVNCTLEVLASNVPCSVVPLPGVHAVLCSAALAWLKPENLEQMCQVSSSELRFVYPCADLGFNLVERALEWGIDGVAGIAAARRLARLQRAGPGAPRALTLLEAAYFPTRAVRNVEVSDESLRICRPYSPADQTARRGLTVKGKSGP